MQILKTKIFFLMILIQIGIIIFLFFQIKNKSSNTLGVSVNTIDSRTIQKVPSGGLKYFYEPKPNAIDKVYEWSPYKATYTINSDSLNERFDYSVNKEQEVFRIITLGDSYTYGLYVDTKDNWTELLEVNLNEKNKCTSIKKFEVINLGVHGYDIGYTLERYRKRGVKYNPNLVIWLFIDQNRITEMIKTKEAENNEKWIKEGLRKNSYDLWRRAYSEVKKEYTPEEINKYQLGVLNKMNEFYNGPLINLFQRSSLGSKQFPYVYDFTRTRQNTYIHQIVSIRDNSNFHFSTDPHPNKEGHKAIAEDVFQYLTKNKLIPCEQ